MYSSIKFISLIFSSLFFTKEYEYKPSKGSNDITNISMLFAETVRYHTALNVVTIRILSRPQRQHNKHTMSTCQQRCQTETWYVYISLWEGYVSLDERMS